MLLVPWRTIIWASIKRRSDTSLLSGVPVISLFDDEFNLYWRDIYWEEINGNEYLRQICFDEFRNSRILISMTPDEYVDAAYGFYLILNWHLYILIFIVKPMNMHIIEILMI